MVRSARLLLLCALALAASACTTVPPWERNVLAQPDMAWEADGIEGELRASVFFSKEAALQGGSAGGGGCGCN